MDRTFFTQLIGVVFLAAVVMPHWLSAPLASIVFAPYQSKLLTHQVGGTIEALALLLNQQDAAEQFTLIKNLAPLFPYTIAVARTKDIQLTDSQLLSFYKGETIYAPSQKRFYKSLENKALALTVNSPEEPSSQTASHAELEVRGTLFLVQNLLAQYPQNQWTAVIARQSNFFRYPVQLLPLSTLPLTQQQLVTLKNGGIVTTLTHDLIKYGSGIDHYYQRVGNSEYSVSAGPVSPYISQKIWAYGVVRLVLVGLFMLLVLGLWLLPTWRGSSQLRKTTDALGAGNTEWRCKTYTASNLNTMANVFNTMAGQLQRLFNSNKVLTLSLSSQLTGPIAEINRGIQQLSNGEDPKNMEQEVNALQNAIENLNQLTSDALLFARFQKAPPKMSLEPVGVCDWINRVTDDEGDSRTIPTLEFKCDEQAEVSIDIEYMSRALRSFIQYTAVSAKSKSSLTCHTAGQYLYISLVHDGPKLSDDELESLNAFPSRAGKYIGTVNKIGELAYAIGKLIITQHQGTLNVGNNKDSNETLTIILPTGSETSRRM